MTPPPSKKYAKSDVAVALLFKTGSGPSIRFVAYRMGWELTDGKVIGPDPAGIFYYNKGIFDQKVRNGTEATFCLQKFKDDGKNCIRIIFYRPDIPSVSFGEFVAFDIHDRAGMSGMPTDTPRKATWMWHNYATMNVTIQKSHWGQQIIIGGQKKANISSGSDLDRYTISGVKAQFTTKDNTNPGKTVTWHKDRAVFFADRNNQTDFVSFLFPNDDEEEISAKDDLQFEVKWTQ